MDTAALDTAIEYDIPHGGYCPRGRLCENGIIDSKYQLEETETEDVNERTQLNAAHSDGTLILVMNSLEGISDGTLFTIQIAERLGKPHQVISLENSENSFPALLNWLETNNIQTLNVAGPRESSSPGIYETSKAWLSNFFEYLANIPSFRK